MGTFRIESAAQSTDVLIIPCFENALMEKQVKELDGRFAGLLSSVETSKDFEGKKQQSALLYTNDKEIPRVLLLGLGKKKDFSMRSFKQAIGSSIIGMQGKKYTNLSMLLCSSLLKKVEASRLFEELVVAIDIAAYAFDEYKDKNSQVKQIKQTLFIAELDVQTQKQANKAIESGQHIAVAVNATRNLGNTPPGIMNPSYLAKQVQRLLKDVANVKVSILSRVDAQKLGMGCFLGVAQGSAQEPKFIILEYLAGKKTEKPTVLVGKGITFDSGGLSLKPDPYMSDMKFDMLGAATAFGSVYAAARLGLKKNIVALMPCCENMPSGTAYRPDDILVAMNGKSVHIDNTDAEGRLVLADALCYAARYSPKEVIDFATLTGACMVALGNERSGLFTKQENMAGKLYESAEHVGEQLWRLPLGDEYSEAMKSEVADYKNIGGVGHGRYGGASTAAAFLEFFTQDPESGKSLYPWAHIDLACSHYGGKGKPWIRVGANGFGIQTMIEYLR